MAKKFKLTTKKERKLIKEIESQRNSKRKLVESRITISPDAIVHLSVRLPYKDGQLLRAAAERQGVSLGEYMDSAAASMVAAAREFLDQPGAIPDSPSGPTVEAEPLATADVSEVVAGTFGRQPSSIGA